jgi:hypothetical protein
LLVAGATACHTEEAHAVDLSCTVEGKHDFASEEQICSSFKKRIDGLLGISTNKILELGFGSTESIGVVVRVMSYGGLVANVRYRNNGAVRNLPDIGIDVMDKPLSMNDVDKLADLVSRQVAEVVK